MYTGYFLNFTILAFLTSCTSFQGNLDRKPAYTFQEAKNEGLFEIAKRVLLPTADEEKYDQLKLIRQSLLDRNHRNKFNISILPFEHPQEILDEVQNAVNIARSASSPDLQHTTLIRDIATYAAINLIKGRGASFDSVRGENKIGTGWYLSNRNQSQSGAIELDWILQSGLLDEHARNAIQDEFKQTDFQSSAFKTAQGFPPQFELVSENLRLQLLDKIKSVKLATVLYIAPPATEAAKTVNELIDEAVLNKKISPFQADELRGSIPLENNLYDESVETLNDPNKTFVDYFGRKNETTEVLDALTRVEKGHILLTGKAGTGKTTILKILSDKFIQGQLSIRGEDSPIILELPITVVTNPTDPKEIKSALLSAKRLSIALNRRIILYIDEAHIATEMTKNAIKGFLTESIKPGRAQVNFIWSTTSDEAKVFFQDAAFSRRFIQIHVNEFNKEETIQLIKQAYLGQWKKIQKNKVRSFSGNIDPDAFEYAYKYAELEQPHAGNPTGTKELLEGSLVRKLNDDQSTLKGDFDLTVTDVQKYIRDKFRDILLPDDPEFNKKFDTKWSQFNQSFSGNEAFKVEFRENLKGHFLNPGKKMMSAFVLFGPPAAGKSYAAEQLSKSFFRGAMLTINGAEYKNGGLELNKLIGSPVGVEGSKEQLSILTKFISENPMGGVIKIEEMDYIHHDIVQLFTNMITDGEFTDGRGKVWKTNRFIIQANSNIGQGLMVSPSAKEKMSWEQYETRKKMLTEKMIINGHEILRVKREKLDQVFDQFIKEIVTKSDPNGDTSGVSQEAQKQKRRYKRYYLLNPDRSELLASGRFQVRKFIEDKELDYGVRFEISDSVIDKVIDLDHYEFEKGHSYAVEKLDSRLFQYLSENLNSRNRTFKVDFVTQPDHEAILITSAANPADYSEHSLEKSISTNQNPWGSNAEIMDRIKTLPARMNQTLKGSATQILETQKLLKMKTLVWDTPAVITLIGTTGNGKTEFYKALASALYNEPDALFKISGINHKYDLNSFFRPPAGIEGGNEETEFERWFKARQNAGGGIILFDELLSFSGLNQMEISEKISAFNALYDLLDEGKLKIGNQIYDARGFVIGITGNSMQELFRNIPKDGLADSLIDTIEKDVTQDQITKYFQQYGFDPPKVARLGKVFVKGPLKKQQVFEVGKVMLKKALREIQEKSMRKIEITVNDELTRAISVEKTTIVLGMRDVNAAIKTLIIEPFTAIMIDLPAAKNVEVKLDSEKRIHWFSDGHEIYLAGQVFDPEAPENLFWAEKGSAAGYSDRTPQLRDVNPPKVSISKASFQAIAVHEFYGHWMLSVMLHGQNKANAINLEPGEGYGGYVSFRNERDPINTLTGLYREMIALQGGHRAVFQENIFASGGGPGILDADKSKRGDDFAGVNRTIESIISNHLIENLSEFSTVDEIRSFKGVMNELSSFSADYLLREGKSMATFQNLFSEAVEKKFIGEDRLEEAARAIIPNLKPTSTYLGSAMEYAISQVLRIYEKSGKPVGTAVLKSFINRSFSEIARSLPAGSQDALLNESKRRNIISMIETNTNRCNQLLLGD